MSLKDQTALRIVLYEGAGSQPLPDNDRFAMLTKLLERGFAVTRTTGQGQVSPADGSMLLVLGRFDQSPPVSTYDQAGQHEIQFQNIEGLEAAAVAERVETARADNRAFKHGDWKPWFPVIDYDRCTNCMQCLSFCLFGVYGVSPDQKIQVQNQDNCKTNCPACSRVCPEAAIMFPKYKAAPINGDLVSEADLQREKMKIDISALLGGDIYQMLRERSAKAKSRFSKERDSDKALQEREKCLVKLQQMGDIPPEVLMSLPSPEEIQRKAQEAAAKARDALKQEGS